MRGCGYCIYNVMHIVLVYFFLKIHNVNKDFSTSWKGWVINIKSVKCYVMIIVNNKKLEGVTG